MKKHDLFNWLEVNSNGKHEEKSGRLFLRVSESAALFVEAQGVESLIGVATEFQAEFSEAVKWWLVAPAKARAFVYVRERVAVESEGETFTNIDRMPIVSGSVLEVQKALRQLKLEQRESLAALRAERLRLKAERDAAKAGADPVIEDENPSGEVVA